MARERLHDYLRALADIEGSDLHIKVGSPARIRVDGKLRRVDDEALTPEFTVAVASAIMRADIWAAFEERNEADFAYLAPDIGRFRVNAFRQRGSAALIFRRVQANAANFEELGLPDVVRRLADEPRGLVLVTGPTGSGKTTTLAAMVDHINRTKEVHVVTIEDPIEVVHEDKMASINQREIGFDTADFATAMRAAMRQDPDVIFVGEMRDPETVGAAIAAAETGHLVFSTLHTIDATETVNRIIDFFPPFQQKQVRAQLAGCLRGTICQRLVPRAADGGRVAALEVMVVNGRIQTCILDPDQTGEMHEIISDGEFYGMQTFDQALVKLYETGAVDLVGAMGAATSPHDLKVMLAQRGLVGSSGRPTPAPVTAT